MKRLLIFLILLLAACGGKKRADSVSIEHIEVIERVTESTSDVVVEQDSMFFLFEEELSAAEVEEIVVAAKESQRAESKPRAYPISSEGRSNSSSDIQSEVLVEEKREVQGQAVLRSPSEVRWGDPFEITVQIAKDRVQIIQRRSNEIIKDYTIPVTTEMGVDIISFPGDALEIVKFTSDRQIVEDHEETTWRWGCVARKTGVIQIKMIISKYSTEGRKQMILEDTIAVRSHFGNQISYFFKNNWQWAWSALLVPLFLFVRRKKKSNG